MTNFNLTLLSLRSLLIAVRLICPDFQLFEPFLRCRRAISNSRNILISRGGARIQPLQLAFPKRELYKTPLSLSCACVHDIIVIERFINDDISIESTDDIAHCNKLTLRSLTGGSDCP